MVTVTKDLPVPESPTLVVVSPEGDYADTDLILCAERANPSEPIIQMQAQYLRYGPLVYQFNTPEELGAALCAIDPASTHDAAQLWREEEARRLKREQGTLVPEDPTPAPDAIADAPPIAEEEEDDVRFFRQEQEAASSTPPASDAATTTPPMPVIDAGEPAGDVAGAASSTPALPDPEPAPLPIEEPPALGDPTIVVDPIPANTSTTTPAE